MTNDESIVMLIKAGRLTVDYENGLVYSVTSNDPGKPLGAKTKKGYLRTSIQFAGETYCFMVHRIVWVSKNGPLPDGKMIDHLDTVKTNNKGSNLEAVTNVVNMDRAAKAGLFKNVGRKNIMRDDKGKFSFKKEVI